MPNAERFKYSPVPTGVAGQNVFVPLLPLRLERAGRVVNVSGLVDSGAAVSVMPYSVGLALGAEWERQKIPLVLGGNLAHLDARALLVSAIVGTSAPVEVVFAWTRTDQAPLLLEPV